MSAEPRKELIERLKVFDPKLTIKFNHNWRLNRDAQTGGLKHDMRYLIAQEYVEARPCGGGMWHFTPVWFPVLPAGRNGGQEWDNRWIPILRENRADSDWDPVKDLDKRQAMADKEWETYIEDYARDRGHWHMKRQFSGYRIPGARDPMGDIMRKEDSTGSRWSPDPLGGGWGV